MRKMRFSGSSGLLVGFVLGAVALSGPATFAQSPDFHIYLGFGQSNMEGGPSVSGLAAANVRFQVMSVVNCPSMNPPRTMGKWYTANPPLVKCTAGPGIVDWFGRNLVDSLPQNIKVGVILVTVIGAKIELFDKVGYQAYLNDPSTEDWLRNAAREYGTSPYGRIIEMAKLAQKDGVIKGILLHQGESNVGDNQWATKVKKIYDDMVADLGLDATKLPLLAGEVVNADMGGTAAGANIQIAKLPGVLPNSFVISSSKVTAGGDKLHFNAEGHKEFGKRYATTMLSFLAKGSTKIGMEPNTPEYRFSARPLLHKNGMAEATFDIPGRSHVSLKIFNLEGREIAEIANAEYPAGRHVLEFGTGTLPAGFSFLRMEADGFQATRRIFLGPETAF